MPVIQIFEGFNQQIAFHCFGVGLAPTWAVDFFINDFTPAHTSVLSSFTRLTLSPWEAVPLSGLGEGSTVDQGDGSALSTGGLIFTPLDDYSSSDVSMFGWLLVDTANHKAVLAERFAAPIFLPHTGAVVLASPRVIFGHYAP